MNATDRPPKSLHPQKTPGPAKSLSQSTADKDQAIETLSEQAFKLLRRDILSGSLAPSTKLKIEVLRERYDMGPTPLREALSRLSTEGLVSLVHQRGFRVSPITLADLKDISSVRLMVETEALQLSIKHGNYDWESRIVSAFHKIDRLETDMAAGKSLDVTNWETRNREFHDALVSAAASPWLLRVRAQLYDHHERYRRLSWQYSIRQHNRDVHEEHRVIRDAALARDSVKAVETLRLHIERTVETIRQALPLLTQNSID